MKAEFTYEEVINFIRLHSLFTKTAKDRLQTLIEIGVIEDESALEAIKQKYNDAIYHSILLSKLIKNSFWEDVIKKITGSNIKIINHRDDEIEGICCQACGYVVFENKEDAFYEICPVCGWQNDSTKGNEYSSCNHCTMADFKKKESFNCSLKIQGNKYIYRKIE